MTGATRRRRRCEARLPGAGLVGGGARPDSLGDPTHRFTLTFSTQIPCHHGGVEMTSKADFAPDEWDLVVQMPRWVVAAASAAQRDLAYRTDHEIEAGYVATAKGGQSDNAFVSAVAAETMKIFDS